MIRPGDTVYPYRSVIINGGKATRYDISCTKRFENKVEYCGWIYVMVKGEHPIVKGDGVKLGAFTGANVEEYNGRQYLTIFAEFKESTNPGQIYRDNNPNREILENDIVEELF